MIRNSKIVLTVLLTVLLFSSIALVRQGDLYFQIKKQLSIFSELYKEVATLYVDEVSPETLMKSGIEAMLNNLDPYTVFIDEGEQQQMEILSTGSFGGIGVDAGFRGNDVVIIAPLEGYPAQRAGLRPGDIIRSVNGVSTDGMSPEDVQQLTIGDVGTSVEIVIFRPGIEQEIKYELERERIEVKNISFADQIGQNNDIAYIHLSRFGQQAAEEIRESLLTAKENSNLNGLILDLRNNPGGLLNEAVDIVDKFIEPGVTVVETKGRITSQNNTFMSEEPAIFEDLPIIVLLNQGSASASEVVAGAFQDLDRAVIVGEESFGKGLVQTIRPLPYNTSMKITVSKYYTPSGRSIQSIDYSGEGGAYGQTVPDSLRRSFQTKNGRTVFDGHGIRPDVIMDSDRESRVEAAILQNNHFFFFINQMINEGELEDESLPDNIYDLFLDYLDEQQFDYETPADRSLNTLEQQAEFFDDQNEFERSVSELKILAERQKLEEITKSRDFIKKELKKELVSQKAGSAERFRAGLEDDPFMLKAMELLLDSELYNSVLTP